MVDLYLLIALVYGVVESLEKLGLAQKYAHLFAIPIGIACSFLFLPCASGIECLLQGMLIGLGAIGSCDTICKLKELRKRT